jgi:hypothetical protein
MRYDSYSDTQRAAWLRMVTTEARTRDVFAFTKHEGVAAGDPYAGVGLAVWLQNEISREGSAPPPRTDPFSVS